MKNQNLFQCLFQPESIAFFGASNVPVKWGFNILHHIYLWGYSGRVYPVNPRGGTWQGKPVFSSLEDVKGKVDLALIVVAREMVVPALEQCGHNGVGVAVVITAGFSETGSEGKAAEEEIVSIARRYGIRLVGPNTMGIFTSSPLILSAMMSGQKVRAGSVAILSQSGNIGTSLALRVCNAGFGVSRLVSTGNEADLTMEDYLSLLKDDDLTRVICIYLEGARDGRRFLSLAREISPKKPVILLKGGQTPAGADAARSHTGAMAGSQRIFEGMCRQAGIIMADDMDQMVDIAGFILSMPKPAGCRAGIVTLGGGWGVLATDACARAGMQIAPLKEPVIQKISSILPPYWSHGNPVDLVAPNRVEDITDSITILLEEGDMDIIFMLGLGYMSARANRWKSSTVIDTEAAMPYVDKYIRQETRLFDLIMELMGRFNKPIVPVIDHGTMDTGGALSGRQYFMDKGIMTYSSPARAIVAAAKAIGIMKNIGK